MVDKKKPRIIQPGDLVIDFQSDNYFSYPALWGMALPSIVFGKLFLQSRGESDWPAGQVLHNPNEKRVFHAKWGYHMPMNDISRGSIDDDKEFTVMPLSELNNTTGTSVGVLYLGEVRDPRSGRIINYEVRSRNYLFSLPVGNVGDLIQVRNATLLETGSISNSRIVPRDSSFDLDVIRDYYLGKFSGQDLGGVSGIEYHKGFVGRNLVSLMRECGFQEGTL